MTAWQKIGCLLALLIAAEHARAASDVLKIARGYKDGGGYKWKGSGTPEEISFKGERILPKGESTYCSGFTFAVVIMDQGWPSADWCEVS